MTPLVGLMRRSWLLCISASLPFCSGSLVSSNLLSEIPPIPELPACDDDGALKGGAVHSLAEETALAECIRAQAGALQPWGVSVRRILHRRPELMYEEFETSAVVQFVLQVGEGGTCLDARREPTECLCVSVR